MAGLVIWVTGLSGAGKTTIAAKAVERLKELSYSPIFLDGDELREILGNSSGVSLEERKAISFCYSNLCKHLADQGFIVIIATISMFEEIYLYNRKVLPNYFEIFIDVPLSDLKSRDPKQIYRRFENKEISNVAGLDLSVDTPAFSDLVVKASNNDTPEKVFDLIFPKLLEHIETIRR